MTWKVLNQHDGNITKTLSIMRRCVMILLTYLSIFTRPIDRWHYHQLPEHIRRLMADAARLKVLIQQKPEFLEAFVRLAKLIMLRTAKLNKENQRPKSINRGIRRR